MPTDDQRTIRAHVERFAQQNGFGDSFIYPITVGEDHVSGDEVFAMLETPTALYMFSMAKDCPSHVDELAIWGESADLVALALVRLRRKVVAQ
jgi:hypothetical protein